MAATTRSKAKARMEKVCLAARRPATARRDRVRQETTGVVISGDRTVLLTGGRAGPSPAAKFPFKQFMVTVAKTSLLNDLASQREQELGEARAIQVGMLPQGPLRAADATICYEFQPFYEVAATFWISLR